MVISCYFQLKLWKLWIDLVEPWGSPSLEDVALYNTYKSYIFLYKHLSMVGVRFHGPMASWFPRITWLWFLVNSEYLFGPTNVWWCLGLKQPFSSSHVDPSLRSIHDATWGPQGVPHHRCFATERSQASRPGQNHDTVRHQDPIFDHPWPQNGKIHSMTFQYHQKIVPTVLGIYSARKNAKENGENREHIISRDIGTQELEMHMTN